MTWGNPLAWIGLAAIGVPMLIHLLTRERSAPLPFPTLTFLRAAAVVELRRRRLTDLLLLALRVAVVALATAALAQPFIASRDGDTEHRLIVIDNSDSVAIGDARRAAAQYAQGAGETLVIERADLNRALGEARGWNPANAGARTVVLISDFQLGALSAERVRGLPSEIGLRMHRVVSAPPAASLEGVASLSFDGMRTQASWRPVDATASPVDVISAHDDDIRRAIAEAGLAAAAAHGGRLRPVTFVLRDAPERTALIQNGAPPDERWMFEVLASMRPGRATAIRKREGRLLVFLETTDAAEAADAIRESIPALSTAPRPTELEPSVLSDDELRSFERPATPSNMPALSGHWVGRWFWLAALLLLGVESLVRRTARIPDAEVARAA